MKIKKAFTLAEILVVLTVIGVIASITIPQLTGGVDDAHYKAGFKKAYSTIANVAAIEKANGNLPQTVSKDGLINFFIALNNNLEVEGYADRVQEETKYTSGSIKQGILWQGYTFGDGSDLLTSSADDGDRKSPWIIAADNMAFFVGISSAESCSKKSQINSVSTNLANAVKKSCLWVRVDINGLEKGPNKLEPQAATNISSTAKLKKLTGDRYYIFIGSDGAAKGSELLTLSGRLLSGQK